MKLHIQTYFFVTRLDGCLAFGKRMNEYFYFPDDKTYKKHFQKPHKLWEFVTYELEPKIKLNNKTIWNQTYFKLLKYAITEQPQVDWAFKTSYVFVEKEEQEKEYKLFTEDKETKIKEYKLYMEHLIEQGRLYKEQQLKRYKQYIEDKYNVHIKNL